MRVTGGNSSWVKRYSRSQPSLADCDMASPWSGRAGASILPSPDLRHGPRGCLFIFPFLLVTRGVPPGLALTFYIPGAFLRQLLSDSARTTVYTSRKCPHAIGGRPGRVHMYKTLGESGTVLQASQFSGNIQWGQTHLHAPLLHRYRLHATRSTGSRCPDKQRGG